MESPKYLANADASTACVLGTGYQARSQLEAIAAVRRLQRVRAFGNDPGRRQEYCREMSEKIGVEVVPAESAEQAVRGAEIVVAATAATKIALEGNWIEPGAHINAIGANFAQKRELDDDAVSRASLIAVDSMEQAKIEAGDLIQALAGNSSHWDRVRELGGIIAGKIPGRTGASQITLFKSVGIASWDLAAASKVFKLATARGMGQQVPVWEPAAG